MDQQRATATRSTPSGSQSATSDVRPGLGLEQLGGDADLVEQLGHALGRRPLPRAGVGAEVGGVDPDQVAAELDDLGLGAVVSGHGTIIATGPRRRTIRPVTPPGCYSSVALQPGCGSQVRVAE